MIQQHNLGLSGSWRFLDQHIAWVRVTVDVTVPKDHLAVKFSDFPAHVVSVDTLAPKPVDVIDVASGTILHHQHSIRGERPIYPRNLEPWTVFENSSNLFRVSRLLSETKLKGQVLLHLICQPHEFKLWKCRLDHSDQK